MDVVLCEAVSGVVDVSCGRSESKDSNQSECAAATRVCASEREKALRMHSKLNPISWMLLSAAGGDEHRWRLTPMEAMGKTEMGRREIER